jgi:hypothetical protein
VFPVSHTLFTSPRPTLSSIPLYEIISIQLQGLLEAHGYHP